MLFCFWTNLIILFGSLLVGLPRIKNSVLLAVPRAPNDERHRKISLFGSGGLFWFGFVLVIAPPKKDNTRTTHTHTYVCRPVVVHLRAQQFVVPIKNAKDHQFEESSKMPPFSGAFVLFCFVLCVYARSSSCPPPF